MVLELTETQPKTVAIIFSPLMSGSDGLDDGVTGDDFMEKFFIVLWIF